MKRFVGFFLAFLLAASPVFASSILTTGAGKAGAGAGGGSTWSTTDKDASLNLSGGNLTVSPTVNAFKGVRSTTSKSTSKWCVAFTIAASSNVDANTLVGIGTASATLSDYVGSDANGYGYYSQDGHVLNNGTPLQIGGVTVAAGVYPSAAAQEFTVCWDFGAHLMWVWNVAAALWNGLPTANPATGVDGIPISSGTFFVMASPNNSNTGSATTVNFNPTGLPSGFSAWN